MGTPPPSSIQLNVLITFSYTPAVPIGKCQLWKPAVRVHKTFRSHTKTESLRHDYVATVAQAESENESIACQYLKSLRILDRIICP